MHTDTCAPVTSLSGAAERVLSPIRRLMETGDPAATVDRLFNSRHVKDLRLIIAVTFGAVVVLSILGIGVSIEKQWMADSKTVAAPGSSWVHLVFAAAGDFGTFFVPVLVVFGAVLAWAYQVGSARLGVVDLFACEISTLCRIATVVDTVRQYAGKLDKPSRATANDPDAPQEPARPFTSNENYFPVFESNNRDLQTLEARVVINITAFYTFMKAARDSLRTLAGLRQQTVALASESADCPAVSAWNEALRNVIYMMYLGLESGRHAICDLVEFEPEVAERVIVILISELEGYRFLCENFTDVNDMHHRRIMLRLPDYQSLVPRARSIVEAGWNTNRDLWAPAWQLLPELKLRFDAATSSAQSSGRA